MVSARKNTDSELKAETEKWLSKIEKEMPHVKENAKNKDFVRNIKAYISDCKHFAKEGKLVLAFEAVVWAWAWLQILRDLKMIE
ncbi:MAG TPA: DUF357 domain-containing protein [Nanoarchaeota archaeon]|nr:DUF357 domain-containing protein [Nanoarchaeota archaeon]HIH34201.1 DUF357 domain-containing protein [Nanoarchaeota archaeon]HIH51423.1 DUF357 domain-containing protein [Nanoarchaeota archaeon]HIH66083.1 DUF357 domain-containing protein [Nanoarchaeota archaeon]